jgi:Cu/Ag efflux pump CusA
VLIGDVAEVADGAAIAFGDAVIQGGPGVLLAISGQYGTNTLEATRAVESVVQEFAPRLQARHIKLFPALHRPASFIETALRTLRDALMIGAVLIVLVLIAFLRDWRSVLISFLAIPLSLFAAVVVLEHYGLSLNTLTLGGFAVALGVLVDDAIIYLENILRRLRENSRAAAPRSRLDVIITASREISGAVIFATGVILLVFLPVFLLTGVQGRFMMPLALAFSLSVVASLVVALTVTPALAALLLRVHEAPPEPRWLRQARRVHQRLLTHAFARPRLVFVALGHRAGRLAGARACARRRVHAEFSRGAPRRAGCNARARHVAAGDGGTRPAHQRRPARAAIRRRRSSSRSAVPSRARTRGVRSAASSTSSSRPIRRSTRTRPSSRFAP